jgi:hypothetical protein
MAQDGSQDRWGMFLFLSSAMCLLIFVIWGWALVTIGR